MAKDKPGFSRAKKKINIAEADAFISKAEKPPTPDNVIFETHSTPEISETDQDVVESKDSEVLKEGDSTETDKGLRKKKMPWDDGNEKIPKGYNIRLNEVIWLKLKYITENTPYSMQQFMMKAIEPAIEKELKKLIK